MYRGYPNPTLVTCLIKGRLGQISLVTYCMVMKRETRTRKHTKKRKEKEGEEEEI